LHFSFDSCVDRHLAIDTDHLLAAADKKFDPSAIASKRRSAACLSTIPRTSRVALCFQKLQGGGDITR
jgi:hypothetical protein